jgi:hypothetical protein
MNEKEEFSKIFVIQVGRYRKIGKSWRFGAR